MSKRLIIYDLDGTLVDTADDITQSVNHMLGAFRRPPLSRDAVIRFIGLGLRQLVIQCLATADSGTVERGMEIYRRHYGEHLLDHTALYPATQKVLEHFSGRLQAVVTNKPNPFTRQILAGLGLDRYFVHVVAGDDGHAKKPDPAGVVSILAAHGLVAREAILIGDSDVDMQAGRRAGVLTVAVTRGYGDPAKLRAAAPDLLIGGLDELAALAAEHGW